MKVGKEFKTGVFVVAVLTMSFFLINYLRGKDLFNKEIEISSRYADIEGLVPSAPVYIKGYKAGKVTEISYDGASDEFTVLCSVRKEFRIPKDSRMTIYGVDIMGGKGIRIDLGTSAEMISDGGFLAPASEPALLDGLASGIGPVMEKVAQTLDNLNVAVSSANSILSDGSISRTIAHIERTMADVSSIAAGVEGKSAELDAFIDNLTVLSSELIKLTGQADTLVSDLSSTVSGISVGELNSAVASFRELLESINDPDGTVGRLIADDSVYDSVEELLNDVDSLVRKIQENPKKYIRISVF